MEHDEIPLVKRSRLAAVHPPPQAGYLSHSIGPCPTELKTRMAIGREKPYPKEINRGYQTSKPPK
jgi:hypothetical protein